MLLCTLFLLFSLTLIELFFFHIMNYYDQQLMYYPPHLFEDGYYLQPPPQVTAAFNDYYYNSGHPSPDSRSVHYRKQRERRKLKRSVSARTISPKQAYSYYQV